MSDETGDERDDETGPDSAGSPLDARPVAYQELPPPPEEIAELVAACFRYVTTAVGVEPDFTLETLPLVDHYVTLARVTIQERPQLREVLARAIGAYFGEVVRRYVRSFWLLPSADVHDWKLCGREVFFSFNPIGFAHEALAASAAHEGPSTELQLDPSEKDAVLERLESLAPVSEEEYFMLATRLEVLQIAAEQLRTQMEAGGLTDVTFDATDYGAPDPDDD